jgi:hypothetical protein
MTDEIPCRPTRRVLLRTGLLAGAAMAGIAAPLLTGTGTAQASVPGVGQQPGWAWCDRCQGLFFKPFQGSSACPAGSGGHNGSESLAYYLYYGEPSSPGYTGVQAYWSWCDKCQGLFYGPFQGSSWCPAGGRHSSGSDSFSYDMQYGVYSSYENGTGWQEGWAWCDKCQGLFYLPFENSSYCPAGGQHDGSESYGGPGYDMFYTSPTAPS